MLKNHLFLKRIFYYFTAFFVVIIVLTGFVNFSPETAFIKYDSQDEDSGLIKASILIDGNEFSHSFEEDCKHARKYVYVQVMSFEADRAGHFLIQSMTNSQAIDKRILADEYSLYYSSDRFLYSPSNWTDEALRKEIGNTCQLAESLDTLKIQFKWTEKVKPLLLNFPARNHKKLIVMDDRIAYIGGINFADHNFAWHDMMIRFEGSYVAKLLKQDFLNTWNGENSHGRVQVGEYEFYFFDGVNNETLFENFKSKILNAKKSIYVISPYITFPFFDWLKVSVNSGVQVHLITPAQNNKPTVKEYILAEAREAGINIHLYPGRMNHMKAILVDDILFIAGSSNFDYLSLKLHAEICFMSTNKNLISDFKKKVLIPDLSASKKAMAEYSPVRRFLLRTGIYFLGNIVVWINR